MLLQENKLPPRRSAAAALIAALAQVERGQRESAAHCSCLERVCVSSLPLLVLLCQLRASFLQLASTPYSDSTWTAAATMNMQTSTGSGSSRPNKDQSAGDDTAQMTAALTAPTALRKLVLNYLVHHCYVDTAQAFVDDGSGSGGGGSGSGSGLGNGVSPAMPASTRSATGKEAEHGAAASGASISQSMPAINCHGSTRRHVSRGHANPQAHPLAAPPLSREDSSMEVEVDSLLALANGGPSGTGRGTDPVNGTNSEKRQAGAVRSGVEALDKAASRSDDELPADELHNVRVRKGETMR